MIIGCPGSGKTTFAKKLHNRLNVPLFHLDAIWHKPDKTHIPREEFDAHLSEILALDEWIIDGNYASTMELRIKECDTIIFLDYPIHICLKGITERRGKARSDMPWIETEYDEEFINFIKNFNFQSRPKIIELLEKYSDKNTVIFKNRFDAKKFLDDMKL